MSGWVFCGAVFLLGVWLGRLIGEQISDEIARANQELDDLRRATERKRFRTRVPLWRRGYLTADGRLTTLAGAAFFHVPVSTAEITRAIWQLAPPRSLPEHAEYIARVSGHVFAQQANRARQAASQATRSAMN